MSFVKRLTATVSANIDRAISQIENHDAVIEAALHETRDATARLKVQVARVKTEVQRTRDEIGRLETEEEKWAERAKRIAAQDEQRALACLRRRAQCREHRQSLESRLTQNCELERRLELDLERLRKRLDEINHRRQTLRGRELSAKGSKAIANLQLDSSLDVDRIFERWEIEITRSEIGTEIDFAPDDPLADDFERTERDAELKDELRKLLNNEED